MKLFNALSSKALMLILGALCGSATALSQTPAQLLQSLTPAQRAALLQGVSSTGSDASAESLDGTRRAAEQQAPNREPRENADKQTDDRKLQARDNVIIEIDFRRAVPAQIIERGNGAPPMLIPAIEAPVYEEKEREDFEAAIKLIRAGNPYELDDSGALIFPGFAPILLAGLDETEASYRLANDPAFSKLQVSLKRIPVGKSGVARLKRFGHDFFKSSPSTFAPVTNIPAPTNYIVSAGDQLSVQLFGAQDRSLRLTVARDGRINFPEIGPIPVAGLGFTDVQDLIEARVSEQMIGVRASVSLGDTRSIQVVVAGDVNFPGTYTVSGLSTIVGAIYAAGGVSETGSFREIELKRAGALVGRFDLYDLLLKGDRSRDFGLQSGDLVFVRPMRASVAVDGAVRRPAIYELRSGETLSELINFSGGFSEGADLKSITVVEYSERGDRRALKFDFNDPVSKQTRISAGSEVIVRRFGGRLDSVVFLEGHVEQPGISKWFDGMTILDLLPSLQALKVGADPRYVLIRRERDDGLISAVSVDLQELLESSDSQRPAPALERRDRVMIFDGSVSRGQRVEPLLRELRLQTSPADPVKIVSVSGAVRWPGQYPLEPGMRVSDLIRAAGGLADQAFQKQAEISRLSVASDGSRMASELISVDLAAALERESQANFSLASRDALVVKPLPDSTKREFVTVRGEVMFPGEYPIQRGETLRSVIERAGGLTPLGFARGAVFTRESLREREAKQIEKLEASLRQELATALLGSVQAGSSTGAAGNSQAAFGLLDQLQQSEAVGRLVIDLDRLLGGAIGSRSDVILRGGDQLTVPALPQEISVIGEVSLPTSHLFRAEFSLENYLTRSGGFTDRADKSRVYVVKSDGTVVHPRRSLLGAFVGSDRVRLEPGDTVVVPPDVAQLPPLPFWQAVTSIIYNAAVAVAAVRSF